MHPLKKHQQQQHPAAGGVHRMGGSSVGPSRSIVGPCRDNDQRGKEEEIWSEREELRRRRVQTCKRVGKDVAKKAVLYGVMAVYTVLGGYAFVALEQTNEKELCLDSENLYDEMEATAAESLWKMSRSFQATDEEDSQRTLIQGQVAAFRDNVFVLNYDGRNCSLLGTANGTNYNWNIASGLLFSVTVFTTVGYGNITPKTTWGRLVCIVYAMFGIPLMFVCLASIGEILSNVFRFVYAKICCLGACQRRRRRHRPLPHHHRHRSLQDPAASNASNATTPTDDSQQHPADDDTWKSRLLVDDDDEEELEEDEMSIPITVTLLVIAGYIGLGTIMFANWEGWDAMDAAYYCFITVSTIGFGDVVPGFSPNDSGAGLKMIVDAFYLVFGMSLMSMGFDLIQYEMKNRVPSRSASAAAPPSVRDDSAPPAGNPGVRPPGEPTWSCENRAYEAALEMTPTATDGIKKRGGFRARNILG